MKDKKKIDLSILIFAGIAYLRENKDEYKKIARQLLILARGGIDYLLSKTDSSKKKTTTIKKIKIK